MATTAATADATLLALHRALATMTRCLDALDEVVALTRQPESSPRVLTLRVTTVDGRRWRVQTLIMDDEEEVPDA